MANVNLIEYLKLQKGLKIKRKHCIDGFGKPDNKTLGSVYRTRGMRKLK
jgi:hypothetical protein